MPLLGRNDDTFNALIKASTQQMDQKKAPLFSDQETGRPTDTGTADGECIIIADER